MGEKELQEILRQARAAVAAGKDITAVNQRVSELTQGQYPGMMSLALSVDPVIAAEEKEAERLEPLLEGSAAGDFLRTLGSGVTFGLSRGLPGVGGRERLDLLREENPKTSFATELAGAGVSPITRALGAGFKAIRGAGGALRTGTAGAATGAAGGAVAGFGEDPSLEGAARGAKVGGLLGGTLPGAAAVGRGATRLARSVVGPMRGGFNERQAGNLVRDMIEQAGISPEEAVRRVRMGQTLADIDPSIATRAPGVVKNAPALRRAGGPVEGIAARVKPEVIQSAKRQIFEPLEDFVLKDKAVIQRLKSDPAYHDAFRRAGVSGDALTNLQTLSFRKIQDLRKGMRAIMAKAERDGMPGRWRDAEEKLTELDGLLDGSVPGFAQARRNFAELMERVEGYQKLAKSLEKAVPTFRPDMPGRIEGVGASMRNALIDSEGRRMRIAELVGEAMLNEGPAAAQRIENMIRSGFYARVFNPGLRGAFSGSARLPSVLTGAASVRDQAVAQRRQEKSLESPLGLLNMEK
jgi:hypothetical protein